MKPERTVEREIDIPGAVTWAAHMIRHGLKAGPVVVALTRPRRTLDQNAKLWPMLQDVASQVEWHGMKLSKEDWKEMFSASIKKQRAVPGLDGSGFVVLGASTSKMNKAEFSDLIELIYSFGAEKGVVWSEPKD